MPTKSKEAGVKPTKKDSGSCSLGHWSCSLGHSRWGSTQRVGQYSEGGRNRTFCPRPVHDLFKAFFTLLTDSVPFIHIHLFKRCICMTFLQAVYILGTPRAFLMPAEARRDHCTLRNQSCWLMWTTMEILGTQTQSSVRATNVLNNWTIPPVQ